MGGGVCAPLFATRPDADVVGHVDGACRTAVHGRKAARALAEWARRFELAEAEFQILWRLRWAGDDGLDQTSLAKLLTFSAAQISNSVERLRSRNLIVARNASSDRRRHQWHLAAAGRDRLDCMLAAAGLLHYEQEESCGEAAA